MSITSKVAAQHPKDDPSVQRLLSRMPDSISASFTTEQLVGLREAIGIRGARLHGLDVRTTFQLPFLPFNFYMVFLMGRNKRALSEREKGIAIVVFLLALVVLGVSTLMLTLLVLYLIKSALGINVLEEHSLGIWDWFNNR